METSAVDSVYCEMWCYELAEKSFSLSQGFASTAIKQNTMFYSWCRLCILCSMYWSVALP